MIPLNLLAAAFLLFDRLDDFRMLANLGHQFTDTIDVASGGLREVLHRVDQRYTRSFVVGHDYESLQEAADAARRPHGAIELEIMEGQVRFRIGRGIWGNALTFEQACDRFAGRG